MFLAEFICLPFYGLLILSKNSIANSTENLDLDKGSRSNVYSESRRFPWNRFVKRSLLFLLLATLDLIGSGLTGIGLLYVSSCLSFL
jgi:hypothetical protein